MLESTEKYIDSQRNAANLLAGSDYLTEQVLAFAVTDNKIHVERYFTEINQNHRRDNALKVLELNFSNSDAYLH